ncbi:MAG: methyltransferase domain-containing protein [Planctomycetaceae bacterium]|nr:methyltransferase domain-containing protein [Planctomycetaceae bacterium]
MTSITLTEQRAPQGLDNLRGCPMCGGLGQPWLQVPGDWRRPTSADAYTLLWCKPCDMGYLAPRPSPVELGAFYDLSEYYTHLKPQSTVDDRSWSERLRLHLAWRADHGLKDETNADFLFRYGVAPATRLLDVGCGNGGLLARMDERGFQVTGVEPDLAARQVVAQLGLRALPGTAESLPSELTPATFEVVTIMHVLEHCLDPRRAVINAAQLLVEGGLLVVETPNNACRGVKQHGAVWRWLDVPRHVNFFTPTSLAEVCRAAGLTIVGVEYMGYARQFARDWIADEQLAWDRLSPRAEASAPLAPRNSDWRSWQLLLASWCSAPEQKYDSVRIVARR